MWSPKSNKGGGFNQFYINMVLSDKLDVPLVGIYFL